MLLRCGIGFLVLAPALVLLWIAGFITHLGGAWIHLGLILAMFSFAAGIVLTVAHFVVRSK